MRSIDQIHQQIEDAVENFQKLIPGLQDHVFDQLQSLVKELETTNGKIVPNLNNLKKINEIRSKLEKIIVNKDYMNAVKDFVQSFNLVQTWHNQYFSNINAAFKPSETLKVIKATAVDATLNSLLDAGITANVIDKVGDILRQNITTGGSYAALTNQLRDHIRTSDSTGDGSLQKYTRQITTDAINQFSGQYHATIAADLALNWGRYIGSNITTTREFCFELTRKEWVHKSELPVVIKGDIDGHHCKLSKATGLPLGMIPGTTAANFQIYRGGYQCGHQFYYVPDSAVPEDFRSKFKTPAPAAS